MRANSFSCFEEYHHLVTWAPTTSQLRKVHKLRADVFCRELGWVGTPYDSAEWDEFDARSMHVAVLDEGSDVVAAVRLTSCKSPWMLDTIFHALASPELLKKAPGTVEASRLVVARRSRSARLQNGMRTCDLLYKGAYAYCAVNKIRYVYMVTSDVVLRHMLQTGLPCEPLAAPFRMADGVNAVAVKLDWHHLSRSSALGAWYQSGLQLSPPRTANEEGGGDPDECHSRFITCPHAAEARRGTRLRVNS